MESGLSDSVQQDDAHTDEDLAVAARDGDRRALECLIIRHRNRLFALAHRMLWNRDAAEDAIQEIFIKMVHGISTFEHRSTFGTWLYRIAVNHLLMWKRQSRAEMGITGFECYEKCLMAMPNGDFQVDSPEAAATVTEAAVGCITAMLLCLSREQRVVYLLGEMFELPDSLSAAVLEISPDAFRQKLSRARRDLHTFLAGNCGLVDPKNPCRCAHKTGEFVRLGIVDPKNLQFAPHATDRIRRAATEGRPVFENMMSKGLGGLFRDCVGSAALEPAEVLQSLISNPGLRALLQLGER